MQEVLVKEISGHNAKLSLETAPKYSLELTIQNAAHVKKIEDKETLNIRGVVFECSHTDSDSLNPLLPIVGGVESVICMLNITGITKSFFHLYSFIFISG